MKNLFIAEKPSVAAEFGKALKISGKKQNGYIESEEAVITWCVGHLVTMSYPEKYDPKYKKWSLSTLPFIPSEFKYEIIDGVKKQFNIVKGLLTRDDVANIYICTDSGREGEYIYRLVDQMSGVKDKNRKRVWIDSQTEEEILRGIREAKDWKEYDNLASSAYLRAKEDYLMGINFSRLLTLKYGNTISSYLKRDRSVISVGRVMTCVLGMVVRREREIRDFVKTPFYRVNAALESTGNEFNCEWKAIEGSKYFESPKLYKDNGFCKLEDAKEMITQLKNISPFQAVVSKKEKKTEKKNPPLLYNLAEIQNDCSRIFKISPDETLKIIQGLYEKKLVTYPRTDARVLSSAVAKEINKNISGLTKLEDIGEFAKEILDHNLFKDISKTRYTNDSQITDHYAIIPTGQTGGAYTSTDRLSKSVYLLICKRFLSVFFPPAIYEKVTLQFNIGSEAFFTNLRACKQEGYLKIVNQNSNTLISNISSSGSDDTDTDNIDDDNIALEQLFLKLKKGDIVNINDITIKEGETSPPKRYSSGSIILAMENAGQLIEDEELRSQIKGSGIGTSATRAEILNKLIKIKYLAINKKTQIITPTLYGEIIFNTVYSSIRQLLNPELTASWEKGLNYVAEGSITSEEYMKKLDSFIVNRTSQVMNLSNQWDLKKGFDSISVNYKKPTINSKKRS